MRAGADRCERRERVEDFRETGPPAAAGSDASEVNAAFRRHDRMLVRWLAQKFGDIETARDIAQSAYLRVWRYAQTQQIDNLQALIFKTAANLAANEFRARRRMRLLIFDNSSTQSEFQIEQVASQTPTPESTAIAKEEVANFIVALDRLPKQARQAFLLSRFEDKTYREIAAILGVSESSVEKYIIAALKALRSAAKYSDTPSKIIPMPNRRRQR